MIEHRLTDLLREVVGINSVSSTLTTGPGERELTEWLVAWFQERHIETVLLPADDGRFNVVAHIKGRGEDAPLMLNAHMDTVGTEEMDDPFVLRVDGDKLWGRGAFDMKCAIAIMLAVAEQGLETPPRRDLWLTFVSDEEDISRGADALVRDWLPTLKTPPSACIVLEPTEEFIGVAHRGFAWCDVTVEGKAAHGSLYDVGIDAIMPLGAAIQELHAIEQEYAATPADPILGRASLHAGTVQGGSAWSIYPAHARLTWERRTLPDENEATLLAQIERVVQAAQRVNPSVVRGTLTFTRQAFRTPDEAPIVRALQHHLPDTPLVGLPFWTDGAIFSSAGLPTVIFGPKGEGAHTPHEWVSLASMVRVYQTISQLVV